MKQGKFYVYIILKDGNWVLDGKYGFREAKIRMIHFGETIVEEGKAKEVLVLNEKMERVMSWSGWVERLSDPDTRYEELRWYEIYDRWLEEEAEAEETRWVIPFPDVEWEKEED